jgi:hypothetical protein
MWMKGKAYAVKLLDIIVRKNTIEDTVREKQNRNE